MKDNELRMFELDLEDAEELETNESPWYIAVGGMAILVVHAVPVEKI